MITYKLKPAKVRKCDHCGVTRGQIYAVYPDKALCYTCLRLGDRHAVCMACGAVIPIAAAFAAGDGARCPACRERNRMRTMRGFDETKAWEELDSVASHLDQCVRDPRMIERLLKRSARKMRRALYRLRGVRPDHKEAQNG